MRRKIKSSLVVLHMSVTSRFFLCSHGLQEVCLVFFPENDSSNFSSLSPPVAQSEKGKIKSTAISDFFVSLPIEETDLNIV